MAVALGFVAFLAVFREGAETALFFQALLAKQTGSGAPIFAGIAAGGATLAVIFSLFHRFGVRIPLRPFFAVTSGLLYWMAFVFAGKGIKELQEGHAVSRTVLPGFPTVEAFGMYPTVETIIAQGVLVALLLFALWRSLRPSGDVAAEAVAALLSPDAFAARRSMVYAVFAVSEVTVNDPEVPAMVGDRLTHSPLSIRYW